MGKRDGKSDLAQKSYFVSRDVVFEELVFSFATNMQMRSNDHRLYDQRAKEILESQSLEDIVQHLPEVRNDEPRQQTQELNVSKRTRNAINESNESNSTSIIDSSGHFGEVQLENSSNTAIETTQ